jgi:hypothetical protein
VIWWDQCQTDWQRIGKITKGAGAHPVLIEELSDLRLVQCCAACCVAVVVTGPASFGVGMQAIRDLKAKGFKVIACEEGAGVWPLKPNVCRSWQEPWSCSTASARNSRATCVN